jgi:excisionase family DNA binding protein
MERPEYLSAHEAAIHLQLSEDTVLNLARNGTLPAEERDGRLLFRRSDVEAYRDSVADNDPVGDGTESTLVHGEAAASEDVTAPHRMARPPSGG